ncbi:MAG: tyrosine-type recombinase/integrase [Acidimicrobiales bacterium]
MARRNKSEGSIHQVDGRWVAVLELPKQANGKRVRRRRMAPSKTEAVRLLREMRSELSQYGALPDSTRRLNDTLDDFYRYREGQGLAPATLDRDRWMLQIIREGLGPARVSSLSVTNCDQFLASAAGGAERPGGERRSPVGRDQIRRIRAMLIAAIRNDIRIGLVTRNVAELSVLPADQAPKQPRRSLTLVELQALCEAGTDAIGVLIDLIGRNGLRPAEARGLKWSDVDLDNMTLAVRRQVNRHGEFVKPKTRMATRTIRIDNRTARGLNSWRPTQQQRADYAGPLWQDLDLIVSTSVGTPITRSNARRDLRRVCTDADVRPAISLYELRHTAISLQAERGLSPWQIADWAGTSERMICDVYRHKLSDVIGVAGISIGEQQ